MNIAFIYYTNNSDAIGIDNKMLSYKNAAIKLNHNAILLKIHSSDVIEMVLFLLLNDDAI